MEKENKCTLKLNIVKKGIEMPKEPELFIAELPFNTGLSVAQAAERIKQCLNKHLLEGNMFVYLAFISGQQTRARIIEVQDDCVVYYNERGLRALFKTDMTDEEKKEVEELLEKGRDYLVSNFYIETRYLMDITAVSLKPVVFSKFWEKAERVEAFIILALLLGCMATMLFFYVYGIIILLG